MGKLQLSDKKALKLTNVLSNKVQLKGEPKINFDTLIEQMQSFIRTKGAMQVGPLIQYTDTYQNDNGEINVEITFMLQCNKLIHKVELPYRMEPLIRVQDCMYCRFNGPEEKLRFAYDKINIAAFETDTPLKGSSYTIFVERNQEEETMIADVFVERAHD